MILELAGTLFVLVGLAAGQNKSLCDEPAPITVNYAYQFLDPSCPPAVAYPAVSPITVTIPAYSPAITVLEQSVNVGQQYRFSATYFGTTLGFLIDSINGTATNGSCFWGFFVLVPGSLQPIKPNLGVASFIIPAAGYTVYMRYGLNPGALDNVTNANVTPCDVGTVTVNYAYEYPDSNCPSAMTYPKVSPITITIPTNGTALNVMQESTNVNSQYRFSATYFGTTLGYFIDTINGTSSNSATGCFWFFYVQAPGESQPKLASVGVSNFFIPTSGYSIYWRYEQNEHDSSAIGGVSTSYLLYLIVMLIAVAFATPYV